METKCPVCGTPMESDKCSYCGYEKPITMQTSADINYISQPPEVAAGQQGVIRTFELERRDIIPGVSRKSKTVALLLCIFLGIFGVHRFYVGKAGMGIVYLFTAGLFGFGWIVDIFLIITDSFTDEFGLVLL